MVSQSPPAHDEGQRQQAELPPLPTVNWLLEFHDPRLETSYQQHLVAGTRPQTLVPLVALHLVLSICTVVRALAGLQPVGVVPVAALLLVAGHLLLLRLTSRTPQPWLQTWRLVGITAVRLAHMFGAIAGQLASEAAGALLHNTGFSIDSSSSSSSNGQQELLSGQWWSPHQLPSSCSAGGPWETNSGVSTTHTPSRPLHTTAAVISAAYHPQLLATTAATPVVGSAVLSLLLPLPLRLHVPLQGLLCVLTAWQPRNYLSGLLSSTGGPAGSALPNQAALTAAAAAESHQAAMASSIASYMDAARSSGSPPRMGYGIWEVLQRASQSLLPLLPATGGAVVPSTQQCGLGDSTDSRCDGTGMWCHLAAVQAVGWGLLGTTCVRYVLEYRSRAAFLKALQPVVTQQPNDSWQQAGPMDQVQTTHESGRTTTSSGSSGGSSSTGHLHCATAAGASASSSRQPPQDAVLDDVTPCWGVGCEQQHHPWLEGSKGSGTRVPPTGEGSTASTGEACEQAQEDPTLSDAASQPAGPSQQQMALLMLPLRCTAMGMCVMVVCLLPLLLQGFRELCQLGDQPPSASLGVWLHMGISVAAQALLAAGAGAAASLLMRLLLLAPLLWTGARLQ